MPRNKKTTTAAPTTLADEELQLVARDLNAHWLAESDRIDLEAGPAEVRQAVMRAAREFVTQFISNCDDERTAQACLAHLLSQDLLEDECKDTCHQFELDATRHLMYRLARREFEQRGGRPGAYTLFDTMYMHGPKDNPFEITVRKMAKIYNRHLDIEPKLLDWGTGDEMADEMDARRDEIDQAKARLSKEEFERMDRELQEMRPMHTHPHWRPEWYGENDAVPPEMAWFVQIPKWLIYQFWCFQHETTAKVFLYLAARANNQPDDLHFGQAWVRYDDIRKWTNVQRVDRCIRELEDLGFIRLHNTPKRTASGGFYRMNIFTITFFHEMRRLGLWRTSNRKK